MTVFHRLFLRWCGVRQYFLRCCGVQSPPMSPSLTVFASRQQNALSGALNYLCLQRVWKKCKCSSSNSHGRCCDEVRFDFCSLGFCQLLGNWPTGEIGFLKCIITIAIIIFFNFARMLNAFWVSLESLYNPCCIRPCIPFNLRLTVFVWFQQRLAL